MILLRSSATIILLLLTSASLAKEITLDIKGKWTPEQLQTIRDAAKVVDTRLGSYRVKSCAYRNAWRGLPDYDGWARAMGVWRRQKELKITIDAKKFPRRYLAKAFVGRGKIDERHDRWRHLEISFGREFIDSRTMRQPKNREVWVRVIAHEIGHNMGLSHGSDRQASWEDNYAGYFVTELGFCTMSYGRTGSDKGDRQLRRRRYKKYGVDKRP